MTDHSDRTPSPDRAERNAFFPSPYSLSQYTAPRTDYDGPTTEQRYTGGRWKVLVLATEERYMRMQNGTFFSTGNHPVETLLPLQHILEAGYQIDVATLGGNPAKFEWWAYPEQDEATAAAWAATSEAFVAPKRLAEVLAGGIDDYAAIFIPGGHGAMNGIPFSRQVREALDAFLAADRLIITLCHGPAALLAAGVDRQDNPFAGYRVVAFPDALDLGANIDIGYLPGQMPWNLGESLQEAGITVSNSGISGETARDRGLLTGDSPLAANQLGKDAALALLESFGD